MKILIFGLPGSGKTTLAKPFAEQIGAVHINADEVRAEYDDWDFTPDGRMRQAMRMKYLADGIVKAGRICVADFVAPKKEARDEFGADFTVWMDTISEGRFEDTNKMFVNPDITDVDYHVSEWFDNVNNQLELLIEKYRKVNE